VYCHAGCEQHRVIAALRVRGAWSDVGPRRGNIIASRSGVSSGRDRGRERRTQAALRVWGETVAAHGTLVETYLAARNITIPVPAGLRFHAALDHPTGNRWPAMVALVTNGLDGTPIAVQRTFLARDGAGKAPLEQQKMMLGPCRGGAVRLGPPGDLLMVGEGIETCLAAMQASGNAAWAALSTSGLRALDLPRGVRHLIVLADGDEPGELAAQDCALRWSRAGRHVRIARPPQGMDFNDLLVCPASCIGETAR